MTNPEDVAGWPVAAAKQSPGSGWTFLLLIVEPAALESLLGSVQAAMRSDEAWYNHFFRDRELIAVFKTRIMRTSTDPSTWSDILTFGRALGIPGAELDFEPRTVGSTEALFDVSLGDV